MHTRIRAPSLPALCSVHTPPSTPCTPPIYGSVGNFANFGNSSSSAVLHSPLSASSLSLSPKFPANYVRSEKIKLKKVLGLTVCSNAALDVSPVSGLLAYPAGCTVVLFNAKRQTQAYLVNTSRKPFTSVAFSRCGRYVATGECGINPAIKVWELDSPNGNLEHTTGGNVVAEFFDHKYAVTCVAFSPTGKYLVSIGSQHDMIVNVFDWRSNQKMASNKISSKVSALSFAEDGSYFVTVGNRHVKYWYMEGGRRYKDPIPLMGRSAILGDLRDNDFCAVACGKDETKDRTYAITRQGHLVEFSSRRLLDKWVQCRTTSANCLTVNARFILVGCAEAIIRIFNAATLEYVTTLPRTHYLGVDVAQGIHINHIMTVPPHAKYPDCVAMVYDEQRSKVSCVYNDHSLYIWDMRDIKRVGKSHSFLYHSTCIWGVETVPYNMERELSDTLPEESFVTCSSDDTIRVWGLDGCTNTENYRKNIYSKELLKIMYIDEEMNFIKDQDLAGDKNSNTAYDGRNGVRCIRISPELQHLASGDRCGNIRIYNLANSKLIMTIEAHESEVLCLEYSNEKIERKLLASASRDRLIHVFDVSQDYLLLQTLDDHSSSITSIRFVGAGLNFQMISCGADKSIMFRTFQGNIFLRGTNTSGKTTLYDMEVDSNAKHILTACQDRNIRVYGTQNAKHTKTFKGSHSDEGSLIKLSLDPSGIYVATSCTDKTLAVYDYYSNECMARMYGHSELVTGLKFTNDCRHLISASGDGCIFVWQVPHDMIVTMQARLSQQRLRSGHAPLPPRPGSIIATPEGIIVESPTHEMEETATPHKFIVSPSMFTEEPALTPGYKFSDVGQLPQWAKRKAAANADESGGVSIPGSTVSAMQSASSTSNLSSSPSQLGVGGVPRARGRWAQRGPFDPDDLRSNSESPLGTVSSSGGGMSMGGVGGGVGVVVSGGGMGNTQTSDYNSASSKDIMYNQTYLSEDSSIDSGMETRRELKFIGSNNSGTVPTVTGSNGGTAVNRLAPEKRKPGLRFDPQSNEHDGDVEDISDGERTSSDHGMFYNNISPSTPTDFKVTAMNEDELRKSMRRQKFDKAGLTLPGNGSTHTASTGTGTGTSDTEDEGSTPSAENAERSLASTLGGSSESIPQATSTFLQAALPEGPGSMLERGSTNRRSISAKHNTENGKPVSNASTITKSFTSTKKDELLKVISEVKQQLENGARKNGVKRLNAIPEVGYRSLRGSHSISDLSLAGNMDNASRSAAAANRYAKTVAPLNEPPQYASYYNSPLQQQQTLPTQQQQQMPLQTQQMSAQQQQFQTSQQYPTYTRSPRQQSFSQEQQQQQPQHFFNCAASRSVLQQSCQAMRQVQQHYPPYPHHVGVHQIHPPPGVPFMAPNARSATARAQMQTHSGKQSGAFNSSTLPAQGQHTRVKRNPAGNARRTPSILKHYKSCPVSPVHEEVEWSADNKSSIIITEPKRHSVYAEDARTILDMIQADTEKMIEEIQKKYGDLDDIGVDLYDAKLGGRYSQLVASQSVPSCLSPPVYAAGRQPPLATPTAGPHLTHTLPYQMHSPGAVTPPKRAVSEYYIYQEFYQCHRNVSLSDILAPEQQAETRRIEEARFLETQRHSSASFFLTSQFGERKSQESLLSDEFLDEGSYCNSMESILSDESDCKSAPMETQVQRHAGIRNFILHGPVSAAAANTTQLVTKSYGSSPNAYGSFDYYMQQRNMQHSPLPYESFDVSSYNLENLKTESVRPKTPIMQKKMPNSKTYPRIADSPRASVGAKEDIPTLSSKNKQYNSGVNKSLSQDFAQQRLQRTTNPLQVERNTYDDKLFTKKAVKPKPPVPAKPQNLVSTLTSTVETAHASSTPRDTAPKYCAFDVDTTDVRCQSRTASVVRKFERNLQKFEREKQAELQTKKASGMRSSVSSGALTTHSCLKKVSKFDTSAKNAPASRRATSMRTRGRPKVAVRFNTVSQIKYTPSEKRSSSCSSGSTASAYSACATMERETGSTATCPLNDINRNVESSPPIVGSLPSDYGGERSFEMYIAENGNEHENMNMDSLKLYTKPELQAVVDEIQQERERDAKHKKNMANVEKTTAADTTTSNQCKNIAKKIDIIQKLIEMEERKLEQIRIATESRMRPFECNSKQKGYVKSLTMNFDMLAKGIEKDIENEQRRIRADSNDADLCAYARHIKRNISLPDVLERTDLFGKSPPAAHSSSTDEDEVELAKEVKADSDVEAAEDVFEHESEKMRIDFDEKDRGNPKSLLPMPVEDSSMRRSCSLSDLHMGNLSKSGKSNGSQLKNPGVVYRNSTTTRSANKRNSLQLKSSAVGLGASSSSIGVLNQASDSENEDSNRGRSSGNNQNRSNGPTAANRQYANKNSNANNNRRKGLQPNFNNAAPLQDDSSSEETPAGTSNSKPIVPPRPRNLTFDHKNKVLNSPNVMKQRGAFEAPEFGAIDGSDPKSQVHNVINNLYTTTQTVMQLHANLKNCEDSLMLKELENAVIMTQNMLTNITQNKNDKNNSQHSHAYTTTEQANLDNGDYLMMVNNCADLLSNFRMKHKLDDCENNS